LSNRYSYTFEEGMERLKSYVSFHAFRFGTISRLNDKEDFESIAHSVIWKCITKYKPQCPLCRKKFISFSAYKKHSHNRRRILKPVYSLDSYIKLRVLSAFQLTIKKEIAQKRLPEGGVGLLESEPAKLYQEFDGIELSDAIDVMLREFTSVERAIVRMLCERYQVSDIITMLEPHGINMSFVRQTIVKFRQYLTSQNFSKNMRHTA